MSTAEYVFTVIGALVIVGGFVYGIYDAHFQKKDSSSSETESEQH
ncbi:MAG: hypothetical protein ACLT3H_08445 [Roseburia sp.]